MNSNNTLSYDVFGEEDEEYSDTKRLLLNSGREAFYRKSFHDSNIRQICADCGLTTGAFYFLFPCKDSLLCAILDPFTKEARKLADKLAKQELAGEATGPEVCHTLMKFLLFHRKEFIILMQKSKGSSREGLREKVFEDLTKFYTHALSLSLGREPREDVVRMLVKLRLEATVDLLQQDYPDDKILFLNDVLAQYAQGGCIRLVDNLKDVL